MAADALPPAVPAFELSIASQGMSKGTLQSEGPQFIPRASLKLRRFQLGGQYKNVSTNSAKGEASAFAGWNGKVGAWEVGAAVTYKMLTSASGSGNRRSWELSGNASRKLGSLGLRGSVVVSPDDFGATRRSIYVEGGPSLDLPWRLKASAAIGHRWREGSADYTSFNVGLSRPLLKTLTADVRLYDTDRGDLGKTFERRLVGALKLVL
ncbi:MAG: hypothetical protein ABIS23_06560 [Sphingomicrobium sp.]